MRHHRAEGRSTRQEKRVDAERRGHARFAISASVEAVELQSKARICGRTSDLGLGGCYVDTISSFPVGAIVKMRLTNQDQYFETKAKVVLSSVGMGMGMMFMSAGQDQLHILEGWIGELTGVPQPEPDLPEIRTQTHVDTESRSIQSDAVGDLVTELMRTHVLADSKGRELLKKLGLVTT